MIFAAYTSFKTWVLDDFHDHPVRMLGESFGMLLSVGIALLLALTTPHPPLLIAYVGWNVASTILLTAALSRGSVGFSVMYSVFLVIDSIGLWRTVMA